MDWSGCSIVQPEGDTLGIASQKNKTLISPPKKPSVWMLFMSTKKTYCSELNGGTCHSPSEIQWEVMDADLLQSYDGVRTSKRTLK